MVYLDPDNIYYTQDSIRKTFRDGRSISTTVAELSRGAISVSDIPRMTVFQENGKYFSLDNRFVVVFVVVVVVGVVVVVVFVGVVVVVFVSVVIVVVFVVVVVVVVVVVCCCCCCCHTFSKIQTAVGVEKV